MEQARCDRRPTPLVWASAACPCHSWCRRTAIWRMADRCTWCACTENLAACRALCWRHSSIMCQLYVPGVGQEWSAVHQGRAGKGFCDQGDWTSAVLHCSAGSCVSAPCCQLHTQVKSAAVATLTAVGPPAADAGRAVCVPAGAAAGGGTAAADARGAAGEGAPGGPAAAHEAAAQHHGAAGGECLG